MGFDSLRKLVLQEIKPTEKETREELAFAEWLKKELRGKLPSEYKVMLMGSVGKGTFLRNSKDHDIFILVPKSVKREALYSIVKNAAKKAFPKSKQEMKYAEHPYVRLFISGRKVDIVPAYNITYIEERASAVDRSVLHMKYISEHLNAEQKEDVLLLKQLLKIHGLYGAEIRVQGFSGYLCELLIYKYGSFLNLLKAVSDWTFPIAIDIESHHLNEEEVVKKFKTQNITVVDPVDPNRDVAAIVSDEVTLRFIMLARVFLKKPESKFFKQRKFESKHLKEYLKRHANLNCFSIEQPKIVDDILWGQLRKVGKRIVMYLEKLDFNVLDHYIYSNGKRVYFLVETLESELPSKIQILGPSLWEEKHVSSFKKSHSNAVLFLKERRIVATEDRKIRRISDALKEFFKKEKDVPSYLSKPIKRAKTEKGVPKEVLEGYFFWRKLFRE